MGEHDHAVTVLELQNEHVDFVADFKFLIKVFKFTYRHRAFALVADIDHDFL